MKKAFVFVHALVTSWKTKLIFLFFGRNQKTLRTLIQHSKKSKKVKFDPALILYFVKKAGFYTPGGRNCLIQAVTAKKLLAHYGHASKIHIGGEHQKDLFKAHAWLVLEGKIVLGAEEAEKFKPLFELN